MCGLVGFFSAESLTFKEEETNRDWFKQMLYMDALRGMDATGVFVETKNGNKLNSRVYKRALPAMDFLSTKPFDSIISSTNIRMALGHNRYSTMRGTGSADKNAHPFTHGDITLMHNGVADNFFSSKDRNLFDVDSDWVAYLVSSHGIAEAMQIATGKFALVWHDASDDSVNLYRNADRPLYFAFSKDSKVMYYASERLMLRLACKRNNIELLSSEIDGVTSDIWFLGENYHIKFTDSAVNFASTKIEPPKPINRTPYINPPTPIRNNSTELLAKYGLSASQRLIFMGFKAKGNGYKMEGLAEIELTCGTSTPFTVTVDVECWPHNNIYNVIDVKKKLVSGSILSASMVNDKILICVNALSETNISVDRYKTMNTRTLSIVDFTLLRAKEGLVEEAEVDKNDKIVGPRGNLISLKKFYRLVKHGCSSCQVDVFPSDADKIEWLDNGSFLCPSCSLEFNASSYTGGMH